MMIVFGYQPIISKFDSLLITERNINKSFYNLECKNNMLTEDDIYMRYQRHNTFRILKKYKERKSINVVREK